MPPILLRRVDSKKEMRPSLAAIEAAAYDMKRLIGTLDGYEIVFSPRAMHEFLTNFDMIGPIDGLERSELHVAGEFLPARVDQRAPDGGIYIMKRRPPWTTPEIVSIRRKP